MKKLGNEAKIFYKFFEYASIIACTVLFVFLTRDAWDKYTNEMTTTGKLIVTC